MLRIQVIVLVGIAYTLVIATTDNNIVSVTVNDPEAKAAIEYAFGQNSSEKEIILTEGKKHLGSEVVYKLKVTINYYTQCADNETNVWVIKTERGCKTTSFCQAEVVKQRNGTEPFRSELLQCIA